MSSFSGIYGVFFLSGCIYFLFTLSRPKSCESSKNSCFFMLFSSFLRDLRSSYVRSAENTKKLAKNGNFIYNILSVRR